MLKTIFHNQFFRNVSTLAFGTIISQIIVVLSSPLLSRLYTVDAFGILSVFTSFITFFAVISTGRFELALGLPDKDENALKLFKLILYIGLFVSLFYFVAIFLLKSVFHIYDKTGFLIQNTVYISPFYVFFIALFSALCYWNQRKKAYKRVTIANALQVITTTVFSIALGFFKVEGGMIWSLVLGIVSACIYLIIKDENLIERIYKQENIKIAGKEYISFPRYMIFSDLSLAASQQFIPILFSVLYSTTVVGFFSMANRMIRLPNIVITNSISNVFRNDAIDEIRENLNCERLYISTLKKLMLMSLPCYLVLFIVSPFVFSVVFGEQWYEAGVYARLISLFLVFEFIATPLNTLFYIRNKQKLFMRLQLINTILGAGSIYLGFLFFSKPTVSLVFFSLNSILFNLLFLSLSYRIAKHNN